MTHLCVNAGDAMKDGGKIAVSTSNATRQLTTGADLSARDESVPLRRDFVCVSVSDTGCGMTEETMNHVFEPFFSTKGSKRGSGLGLATVYGIVTQSGGCVEVDSSPGKGTAFRLYLPRCLEDAPSRPAQIHLARRAPSAVGILLVEDDSRVKRTVFKMLQTLGYKVHSANGPFEALSLLESSAAEVDLLITDVIMPEMNGRQLSERVRACKPEVRCLYMSGYSAEVVSRQGILEKGTHLLHKPFRQSELDLAIQSLLADQ